MRSSARLWMVHGAAVAIGAWMGLRLVTDFHGVPSMPLVVPLFGMLFNAPVAVVPAAFVSGSLGCLLGAVSGLHLQLVAAVPRLKAQRGGWLLQHRGSLAMLGRLSPIVTAAAVASLTADMLTEQIQPLHRRHGGATADGVDHQNVRWSSSKFTEVTKGDE